MSIRHRPSLLGALLWIGLGILFLLQNFGIGPNFWVLAGRYWPVLLILLGLGKVIDYYFKKDAFSIRIGEIIGICVLILIGTSITSISETQVGRFVRELPIEIGDYSVRPGQWIGESHTFTEEASVALEQSMPIRIENSYGTVSVSPGSDREVRVRLKKVVYGKGSQAKDFASKIRIEAGPGAGAGAATADKPEAEPLKKTEDSWFVVRTNRESLDTRENLINTDMEVLVPKNSQLEIRNAFGEIRAANIEGPMELSTTHRPLDIRDCTGPFTLSNRYGETRLTNLKGNVTLTGRGKIYLENIKGDVNVTNEYSPLEISNVDGKVAVSITENSVRVEKVTGPVTIEARGARVNVDNLKDSLRLTVSHQGADISGVAGGVVIESRFANLSLKDIGGNAEIQSNSDNVRADEIKGSLKLKGRASGVRVHRILGPLDIQTTLKDVTVSDAAGSCSITNEHGNVSVSAQSLDIGGVRIRNRNGAIELSLPEGSSFEMDAVARNGNIQSSYPDLGPSRKDGNSETLKSKIGTGGPRILLETEYDNIRISGTARGAGVRSVRNAKSRNFSNVRLNLGIR